MANKSDNEPSQTGEPAAPPGKSDPTVTEPQTGKGSTLGADEYGEPLNHDDEPGRHEHFRKRPLYKRPAFLIGALVVLVIVTIVGVRYWLYARSHESTDDAFIDGHIIQISPKVSGYIARVYVTDNQQVKAGDLLAELDARD